MMARRLKAIRTPDSPWAALRPGASSLKPRALKEAAKEAEAAKVIESLISQYPLRTTLFKSNEFLSVIESIIPLPDKSTRLTRLLNVLSPFAMLAGKRQFRIHGQQPFGERAKQAAQFLRCAAKVIGTDEKPLAGVLHQTTPYIHDDVLLLEIQGDLGNTIYQIALALESAATDRDIDKGICEPMSLNSANVARAGVAKNKSHIAVPGFLARELMEIIPPDLPKRFHIASKLLSHVDIVIDGKKLRALAKRGH